MSNRDQKMSELIARIWKEEDFKQKFLSDPKGILSESGIPFPANVNVKVHLNTADTINLVIPRNPAESELSDEALSAISGGTGDTCAGSTCGYDC